MARFSQLRLLEGARGLDELLFTACSFEYSSLIESPNKVGSPSTKSGYIF